MEREHHDDEDSSTERRPYRGRDAGSLHVPLHLELALHHEDDDDEEDDAAAKRQKKSAAAPAVEHPVEIPATAVSIHPLEQIGVLPPMPEALSDESDDDETPAAEPLEESPARVEPHQPMTVEEFWAKFGPELHAEAPSADHEPQPDVNPAEVIYDAAADRVDPTASPLYAAVHHSGPPPQNQVPPPIHNTANTPPNQPQRPPTPPTRPPMRPPSPNFNAPPPPPFNHGGNFNVAPPPPPFVNANGPHNPNSPLFNQMNMTPTPPMPNVLPRLGNHETIIKHPNMLAALDLLLIMRETSKRKKADAELAKQNIKTNTQVARHENELQTLLRKDQEAKAAARQTLTAERSPAPPQPNVLSQSPYLQATERPRATEQPARYTAAPTNQMPRPAAPEQRPASVLFGSEAAAQQPPESGEQPQTLEAQQEPARRERSNWHEIPLNNRGEVMTDAINYGRGFQQERMHETTPQVLHQDAGAAVGSLIGATIQSQTTNAPQIHAVSPSLPSGMTVPSLPRGQTHQDLNHRLPAPQHAVRDTFVTVLLWVLVALFAFAVVSGVSLLF